jgi:hypothetical protein
VCHSTRCVCIQWSLDHDWPQLKLKLIYDRRSVGQSVLVSGFHLEPMTRFLFSVWRLRVSWCEAPSLTRGRVCNLFVQLLLGFARAVTLGSKPRTTHDHILLSHLRLQVPVFISYRNRVAQLYPRALGSILSPLKPQLCTVWFVCN